MTEISKGEMVEWLEEQKNSYGQMIERLGLNCGVTFDVINKKIAIIDAILAALVALEPVTKEEGRKELAEHFRYCIPREDCPLCDKIRNLIVGNQGGTALEKLKITDEDRKVIASMAEEIGECDYTDTVKKIYEILELFGIKDNEPIKEESDD